MPNFFKPTIIFLSCFDLLLHKWRILFIAKNSKIVLGTLSTFIKYSRLNFWFWESILKNEKYNWPSFAKSIDQSLFSKVTLFYQLLRFCNHESRLWRIFSPTMTDSYKKFNFFDFLKLETLQKVVSNMPYAWDNPMKLASL